MATLAFALVLSCAPGRAEVRLASAHAIVVDEATGQVLLSKDVLTAAPIASLTKLITAMVVLDARQDANERLRIEAADLDHLKHSRGGVPVGAVVSRGALLELALIASDNHAASALARHYPGGIEAFHLGVVRKTRNLALESTLIADPTGLSPHNMSSAEDMVKVLRAAASYPEIAQITSKPNHEVLVNGRSRTVRNTNRLVGAPGWDISLSKTGYTNEAGRCVSMRVHAAGRTVIVVLMGAVKPSARKIDATNILRWLSHKAPVQAARVQRRYGAHIGGDGALEPRRTRVAARPLESRVATVDPVDASSAQPRNEPIESPAPALAGE